MADETRCCTACSRDLPLSAFGKDARLKSGVRAVCKSCDRAATAKRRNGGAAPKPGKLFVLPPFPEQPPAQKPASEWPGSVAPTAPTAHAGGTYVTAAERFIAALDPPAGDSDALLVENLRGLATAADLAADPMRELAARTGIVDPTREIVSLTGALVRVQRELAATRAAKGAAAPAAPPASRLASGQF